MKPDGAGQKYIAWLQTTRGYTAVEARCYVRHGASEVEAMRRDGRPDPLHCTRCNDDFNTYRANRHLTVITPRERATARRVDMTPADRRWERIQRDCKRIAGCIYPVNHSGPCKRSSEALRDMLDNSIAALDARDQ